MPSASSPKRESKAGRKCTRMPWPMPLSKGFPMPFSDPVSIAVKRLPHGEGLPLPAYATEGAAGLDVVAAEDATLAPGGRHAVATGFAIAIPAGYEVQVRPRSGLALKHGISLPN